MDHWLCIPPALLFFLWNPGPVGFVMILYAFVVNLPCILAQRFNRPVWRRWSAAFQICIRADERQLRMGLLRILH
jgi:hypothetical protein